MVMLLLVNRSITASKSRTNVAAAPESFGLDCKSIETTLKNNFGYRAASMSLQALFTILALTNLNTQSKSTATETPSANDISDPSALFGMTLL